MSSEQTNHPQLIKEAEAARILSVEISTLRRWRWAGRGPRFVRLGSAIRYETEVLTKFIKQGRRTSTSDPGLAAGDER